VLENKVLRTIFGPKEGGGVTGEWRRRRNEELHDFLLSTSHIRVITSRRRACARHVARIGQRTGASRDLVGKSEGQAPLGRPRRRLQNNVYMDL